MTKPKCIRTDLSGMTVYDLEPEDFEKLFCQLCRYQDCERSFKDMSACQLPPWRVDIGCDATGQT